MGQPKPWILIDTQERVFWEKRQRKPDERGILHHLIISKEYQTENFYLGLKSGGPGDFIIVDRKNRLWGIERKTFNDCYQTIQQLDKDGMNRLHGQLAELVGEFGSRAVFMVHEYVPMMMWVYNKKTRKRWFTSRYKSVRTAKRAVYSTMSTRSLVMPVWTVGDDEDAARYLIRMANLLHHTDLKGRNVQIIRKEDI